MTPREKECYDMMKCGLWTAEIAIVMNISTGAAKTIRKRVNRQITLTERDRLARRSGMRWRKEQETIRLLNRAPVHDFTPINAPFRNG